MYYITKNGYIYDHSKDITIPNDPSNSHYKKYLKWVDEGNTPQRKENIIALDEIKKNAITEIDVASENQKLKYMSFGIGKMIAYSEKYEEAADYKASSYPKNLDPYPYIKQESLQTGDTGKVVANRIIKAKSACLDKFSKIEGHTQAGKMGIRNAEDEFEVSIIKTDIINSIQSI